MRDESPKKNQVERRKNHKPKKFDWRKVAAEQTPDVENRDPKNLVTR